MINRKITAFLLTILLIAGSSVTSSSSYAAMGDGGSEQIKVIVGFKTGIVSSQASKNASIQNHGGQIGHDLKLINAVSATMTIEEATKLSLDSTVAFVEPDYPVFSLEQSIPWGIEKSFGGENYPFPIWNEASGSGINVAVLDTGISGNHEDLSLSNVGVNYTNSGSYNGDVKGHGTHVAGIISAQDNTIGVTGISPKITLYSVKVLDDNGNGQVSDVIEGIQWAVANGMKVVNMSLGTSDDSQALEDACIAANNDGLLLVAAAGNEYISGTEQGNVLYPAKYESVIAVSALNETGGVAYFSSTGPEVDIIAPGSNILSSIPGSGGNISTGGITYLSSVLIGSTLGAIQGQLVDCGTALTEKSIEDAVSNAGISGDEPWIALIDRDITITSSSSFSLKVSNAMTYGALGAVIINSDGTNSKDPGSFTLYATTSDEAVNWIPTVSVSKDSGVIIRNGLAIEGTSRLGSLAVKENAAYGFKSGTSMAAPHVAGVAALLWSANPSLTNGGIKSLLLDNTQDLGLSSSYQGRGLLRADFALNALYDSYPPGEVKTLTIGGFTASGKIYDGTTSAVTGAGFSTSKDSGDELLFSFNADFEDKNVGINKTVNFTNIRISGGADRYQYKLAQTTGSGIATISQAALTVKVNNVTKTIESGDPAFTATYAGLVTGDTSSNLAGTLAFERQSGEAIGTYIITPSGLTSTNYAITFTPGILTIQEKTVVVPDPPAGGGGGGGGGAVGGGGGGGMVEEPVVIIPVITPPAITISQITIRFAIGVASLYSVSGTAIETVTPMDAAPVIYQGRTMLPVRFIVEPLGGTVLWDKDTQKVTIVKGNKTIELWIGSNLAKINGVPTFIDTNNANVMPILVAPGRTMLPVRFISEALGCSVDWNQERQEITVKGEAGDTPKR